MLDLEKGRVDVLRSVAERIERGHQEDDINKKLPPSSDGHSNPAGLTSALLPGRGFLHISADEEHQERRQGAYHKHPAPTEKMVAGAIKYGGEQVTAWITGLQQSRNDPPGFRGNRFHSQRGADTPFAPHGNSIQAAENYENR